MPALRQLTVTGLDVGWGQIWPTFETAAGRGVTVVDASTGVHEAVYWQLPGYDCATNPLGLTLANPGACCSRRACSRGCWTRSVTRWT